MLSNQNYMQDVLNCFQKVYFQFDYQVLNLNTFISDDNIQLKQLKTLVLVNI